MLVCQDERIRVRTVDAGRIRLDGGAMFGVVPKPLWEKRIPADERNRIPLQMRCLLVEVQGERILVDTGAGDKEDEKFRDIYGLRNEGSPTRLQDALAGLGLEPTDIDVVVNTHLHFDHAGGNTVRAEDGSLRPAFPEARYVVRQGEWDFAHREDERTRASYIRDNFDPLEEAGVLEVMEGDGEIAPGVRLVHTPGHTPHHQSVVVECGGETVFYPADLVPTRAHVPLPWIMGYDVEPLVTLESKRTWLTRAGREGWLLVLEHDPGIAYAWARPSEGDGCRLVSEEPDPDLPEEERLEAPDRHRGPAGGPG